MQRPCALLCLAAAVGAFQPPAARSLQLTQMRGFDNPASRPKCGHSVQFSKGIAAWTVSRMFFRNSALPRRHRGRTQPHTLRHRSRRDVVAADTNAPSIAGRTRTPTSRRSGPASTTRSRRSRRRARRWTWAPRRWSASTGSSPPPSLRRWPTRARVSVVANRQVSASLRVN